VPFSDWLWGRLDRSPACRSRPAVRRLALEELEARLAPASALTVVQGAAGSGSLDSFLSPTNGTLSPADGGNNPGTLSTGALTQVGPGVDISVGAQASITFSDLGGTLALQTGPGHAATFFISGPGADFITFANTNNTLGTAGGDVVFSAGANLTVGNISSAGGAIRLSAGGRVAGNLAAGTLTATGAVVTLQADNAAGGAISQTGAAAAVVAGDLVLNAATGIGSSAAAFQTAVGGLVAQTGTGGIFVSNTGDLTVGFAGDPFRGVQVTGASGDVLLTAAGSVNVLGPGEVVHGPAAVTLRANGVAADIRTGGNNTGSGAAVLSGAGAVTLQAGRDLLIGDAAGNASGDVSGHTGMTLTAGRDVTVDAASTAAMLLGTLSANAGRNLGVIQSAGASPHAALHSFGSIALTAGVGGTFTVGAQETINAAGGEPDGLTIGADSVSIAGITAGFTVALAPLTSGLPIHLGDKPAGALGLTNDELNQFQAATLRIGSAASGSISVTALIHPGLVPPLSPAPALSLLTGGAIVEAGGALQVAHVALQAVSGIGDGTPLHTVADWVAAFNSTSGAIQIANTGSGEPTTATLVLGTVDGVSGVRNGGGAVQVSAERGLEVAGPVSAAGAPVTLMDAVGTFGGTVTVGAPITGSSATILGGDRASDTFVVEVTGPTPLTIDGQGGGTDSYQIILGNLVGAVNILPTGAGTNDVTVSAAPTSIASAVVTADQVIGNGNQVVNYAGVQQLTVVGRNFSTPLSVQGTAAGTPVQIVAQGSAVTVSSPAGTLDTLRSPLTVVAQVGNITLNVSEAQATAPDTVTVTDHSLVSTGVGFTVNYQTVNGSFAAVNLTTGEVGDTVFVQGTAAGTATAVNTGAGDDTVYVSSAVGGAGDLSGLKGPLAVDGGPGSNFLTVSEAGAAGADTVTVTDHSVSGPGFSVAYRATGGSFRGVNFATGQGADRVNVQSSAAGAVTGVLNFGGADTIDVCSDTVHNQGDLSGLKGLLLVEALAGSDLLVVSEAARQTADDVTVTGNSLSSGTGAGFAIAYAATAGASFAGVNFAAGAGDDTVNVVGAPPGVLVGLFTMAGSDTVNVTATPGDAAELLVDGGPAGDVLTVTDLSGTAAVHNTPSGPGAGLVQVTYANQRESDILYVDVEQVFTNPAAS
jgi:hypothetical protein